MNGFFYQKLKHHVMYMFYKSVYSSITLPFAKYNVEEMVPNTGARIIPITGIENISTKITPVVTANIFSLPTTLFESPYEKYLSR